MTHQNADVPHPEELDELSSDLRELDSFLLLDGAVWRRRLPETDTTTRHAIARIDPADSPAAPLLRTRGAGPSHPTPSSLPPTSPRLDARRGLIAVAAMIAVVALLGTLLHGLVGSRQGTTAATHRPQPSYTSVAGTPTDTAITLPTTGAWSVLDGFQGKLDVVFASPQIAYAYTIETVSPATPSKFGGQSIYTLQVTQDGGKSWQNLTLPVAQPTDGQSSDYSIYSLFTQPCSCQYNAILYIALHLATAALCQPYGGHGNGGSDCFVQFSSFDAGQSWERLQLPAVAPDELGDPVLTNNFAFEDKYVYSTIVDRCDCSGTPAASRIVVAVNGRGRWQIADDGLHANGLGVDFMGGSYPILYAIVEPADMSTNQLLSGSPPYTAGHLQLYTADPANLNPQWFLVGDVPHNSVDSLRVGTVTSGVDANPTLYITSSFDVTTPNASATRLPSPVVNYSFGLGQLWKPAPTQGIPIGYTVLGNASNSAIGAIPALLPDGTALIFFSTANGGETAILSYRATDDKWKVWGQPFSAAQILSLYVDPQSDAEGHSEPHVFYLTTDSGVYVCDLT